MAAAVGTVPVSLVRYWSQVRSYLWGLGFRVFGGWDYSILRACAQVCFSKALPKREQAISCTSQGSCTKEISLLQHVNYCNAATKVPLGKRRSSNLQCMYDVFVLCTHVYMREEGVYVHLSIVATSEHPRKTQPESCSGRRDGFPLPVIR